jgi:hypothetical protein
LKKAANYRVALPLIVVAVAAIAFALMAGKSSAQGRTLDASFNCGPGVFGCIDVKYGDAEAKGHGGSTPVHEFLTIDPGTYWLAAADTSGMHNIALRGCPGSDSVCGPIGAPAQELTPICNDSHAANPATPCSTSTEIDSTTKVLLKQGWYRLVCQAPNHESLGMYVDIHVVGTDDGGEG